MSLQACSRQLKDIRAHKTITMGLLAVTSDLDVSHKQNVRGDARSELARHSPRRTQPALAGLEQEGCILQKARGCEQPLPCLPPHAGMHGCRGSHFLRVLSLSLSPPRPHPVYVYVCEHVRMRMCVLLCVGVHAHEVNIRCLPLSLPILFLFFTYIYSFCGWMGGHTHV